MAAARQDPAAPVPRPGRAVDPVKLQFPRAEHGDSVCLLASLASSQHRPGARAVLWFPWSGMLGCGNPSQLGPPALDTCFGSDLPPGTSIFPHDSWIRPPCSQCFSTKFLFLKVRGVKRRGRWRGTGFRRVKIQNLSKELLSLVISFSLGDSIFLAWISLKLVNLCVCSRCPVPPARGRLSRSLRGEPSSSQQRLRARWGQHPTAGCRALEENNRSS